MRGPAAKAALHVPGSLAPFTTMDAAVPVKETGARAHRGSRGEVADDRCYAKLRREARAVRQIDERDAERGTRATKALMTTRSRELRR